jgi:hypothetical protein
LARWFNAKVNVLWPNLFFSLKAQFAQIIYARGQYGGPGELVRTVFNVALRERILLGGELASKYGQQLFNGVSDCA